MAHIIILYCGSSATVTVGGGWGWQKRACAGRPVGVAAADQMSDGPSRPGVDGSRYACILIVITKTTGEYGNIVDIVYIIILYYIISAVSATAATASSSSSSAVPGGRGDKNARRVPT